MLTSAYVHIKQLLALPCVTKFRTIQYKYLDFSFISERAKRASSVMFVFNRDFRYVYIYMYIYVAVRQVICACLVLRNEGGVKC